MVDGLVTAREALSRCDWHAALDATLAVEPLKGVEEAERLDLRAEAAWWLGRLGECTEARQRAYRLFDDAGESVRAGRCATWLYEHHGMLCHPTIAQTWLRRARRHLETHPDGVEYQAMLLREVEVVHGQGRLVEATEVAEGVVEWARREGDRDLEAEAQQALGRLLIDRGQTVEGLARLDEAMLYATEGRLGPYATGKVYCSLTTACEALGDMARAAEWTEATARWASDHPFTIFPGICRVHRAAALGWRGELAVAEREAADACVELIDVHVPNAAVAHSTLGDLRRRLGDFDGAEQAFAVAEELCGRSCGGTALLRLAQGQVEAATAAIQRALAEAGWNRLARAELLPARVQIAVAAGDLPGAADSVEELEAIAEDFDLAPARAAALVARARLDLAKGDVEAAGAGARLAVERWQALEVRYEVAEARALLGEVLRAAGDLDAASDAFAAAEAIFEEVGARHEVRALKAATGRVSVPGGLSAREVEVLGLVAEGCTNKEIGDELGVSAKTVSRHLSNIFTKLGVSSRAAAAAFAVERGLTRTVR